MKGMADGSLRAVAKIIVGGLRIGMPQREPNQITDFFNGIYGFQHRDHEQRGYGQAIIFAADGRLKSEAKRS